MVDEIGPNFRPKPALRTRRLATISLLLLACFLPRAVAAWHWDVLWGDSLHYVNASIALEQGDFKKGFAEFGLNIYPLMLIPLRRLGIDWQIAGKWFSVLAATFAVVPIWAWLRRMFDDRTATLACLVYALHGKLIAISPLIIRDQTFWFLLATTLYLLWRAACEARVAWYLAAGAALTLAIYTRTEGWLLLVPLLGWTAGRWFGLVGRTSVPANDERRMSNDEAGQHSKFDTRNSTFDIFSGTGSEAHRTNSGARRACAATRLRLACGALICLAVLPASLAAVNATWLRQQPRWELLRENHWEFVLKLWNDTRLAKAAARIALPKSPPPLAIPPSTPQTAAAKSPGEFPPQKAAGKALPPSIELPPAVPKEKAFSSGVLTFKLLERVAKGLTWVGSLLLLIGIVAGRRVFLRPEHLTLLAMNVLLLVVSGIRYRSAGVDLRYFMPMVIVGLPWMASGAEILLAGVPRLLARLVELPLGARRGVACAVAAALVVCSLLDAPLPAAASMRRHTALGCWMRGRSPTPPALTGNFDDQSLEAFHSGGHCIAVISARDCLLVPPPGPLVARTADFVVLWNSENLTREQLRQVEERMTAYCGYCRVPPAALPPGDDDDQVMVFARK